jgi:flagellar biosynthesis/type III secretory pathway protein FliH
MVKPTQETKNKYEARKEERAKRLAAEAKIKEDMKADLAKAYGVPRNEKFEKAWNLAWEYGHSAGYAEVENYFDDLVELIK